MNVIFFTKLVTTRMTTFIDADQKVETYDFRRGSVIKVRPLSTQRIFIDYDKIHCKIIDLEIRTRYFLFHTTVFFTP